MVYLLGVVVVATRCGRGPSLLASVLSVAAFDFFFVPPYFTFAVSDTAVPRHLRRHAGRGPRHQRPHRAHPRPGRVGASERERRIAALYAMSRELASTRDVRRPARRSRLRHIADVFRGRVAVLLPGADGRLAPRRTTPPSSRWTRASWRSAQWVLRARAGRRPGHRHAARARAGALRAADRLARRASACSGSARPTRAPLQTPEQLHQLETFASQTALAIERAQLAEDARAGAGARRDRAAAQLAAQLGLARSAHAARRRSPARRARCSRTRRTSTRATRRELLQSHHRGGRAARTASSQPPRHDAPRGGRASQPHREWQPVEEVVGAALEPLRQGARASAPVTTRPARPICRSSRSTTC